MGIALDFRRHRNTLGSTYPFSTSWKILIYEEKHHAYARVRALAHGDTRLMNACP